MTMDSQDRMGGFMVVLGGVITAFVNGGFYRSGTIMYERLLDHFGESKTATAWAVTLSLFISWNLSFIPALLTKKYGGRLVVMIGGMLKFLGILLTAFSPNLACVYAFYGIINGFGITFSMDGTNISVAQSFNKKRGRAMAIYTAGGPLGGIVFAPLIQFMSDTYGYTGMLLILSAISLHLVIAGALLRPISKNKTLGKLNDITSKSSEKIRDDFSEDSAVQTNDINTENSPNNVSSSRQINDSPPKQEIQHGEHATVGQHVHRCLCKIRQTCHFLCNPLFLFYCISICTTSAGVSVGTTFFAGLASEKGVKPMDTALLVSVASGVALIGRLMSGPLFDFRLFRNHRLGLQLAWILFSGVFTVLLPVASDFISLAIVWCLFILASGIVSAQFVTVVADLVGADRVPEGLSVLGPAQGIPSTIGPLIGGYIKDTTGTYTYGFYGGGVLICFGPVLLATVTLFHKYIRPRPLDVASDTEACGHEINQSA